VLEIGEWKEAKDRDGWLTILEEASLIYRAVVPHDDDDDLKSY
jgi:hypothetical protein